jgi:hypothetical protein
MVGYVVRTVPTALNPFVAVRPVVIGGDEVEGGEIIRYESPDEMLVAAIGKRPLFGHDTITGFFPCRWTAFIRSDTLCENGDTTVCVTFYRECNTSHIDEPGIVSVTGPNDYTATGMTSGDSPFCFVMHNTGTYNVTFTPTNSCAGPASFAVTQDCRDAGTTVNLVQLTSWVNDAGKATGCCHNECDCPPPKVLHLSGAGGNVTMTYGAGLVPATPGYVEAWRGAGSMTVEGAELFKCTSGFNTGQWVARRATVSVPVYYAITCDGHVFKEVPAMWVCDDECNIKTLPAAGGTWLPGLASALPPGSTVLGCSGTVRASGVASSPSWCPVNVSAPVANTSTAIVNCTISGSLHPGSSLPDIGETVTVSE